VSRPVMGLLYFFTFYILKVILPAKIIKRNVSKGKRVRVIPQTQQFAVSIKKAKQVSRNRKDKLQQLAVFSRTKLRSFLLLRNV
jgi:hypothetical protein